MLEQDTPYSAHFTRVNGFCLNLPKTLLEIHHKELLRRLPLTFFNMTVFVDWARDDYQLLFKVAEDLTEALKNPSPVNSYIIPTCHALYRAFPIVNIGSRVNEKE